MALIIIKILNKLNKLFLLSWKKKERKKSWKPENLKFRV